MKIELNVVRPKTVPRLLKFHGDVFVPGETFSFMENANVPGEVKIPQVTKDAS